MVVLHGWNNVFIMAGAAATTLIGLLFISVTVGTSLSTLSIVRGTRSFLTPTLTRFGSVLFVSLAVLVPWTSAWPIGIILSVSGLAGLAYQIKVVVVRHRVGFVQLGWDDWIPWVGVPALGSAGLVAGAIGLLTERAFAPYAIAGAAVLLLFAGIYGAWDFTLWMIKNRETT